MFISADWFCPPPLPHSLPVSQTTAEFLYGNKTKLYFVFWSRPRSVRQAPLWLLPVALVLYLPGRARGHSDDHRSTRK